MADLDVERAREGYAIAGVPRERVVEAETAGAANDAIRAGKYIVARDAKLLTEIDAVESVVDATGNPAAQLRLSSCLRARA
jgi:predicted homoserine dehydrogenase-like protein